VASESDLPDSEVDDDQVRGLIVIATPFNNKVLLRVPRAAFIAQLHYHEDMNDLVWEMPLALSLLKEIKRKKSSEFYHYVNTMTREPQSKTRIMKGGHPQHPCPAGRPHAFFERST